MTLDNFLWKNIILKRCQEFDVTIEPDEKVFDSYRTCFSQALLQLRKQNMQKWEKLLKNKASTFIGAESLLLMTGLLPTFLYGSALFSSDFESIAKVYKTVIIGDGFVVRMSLIKHLVNKKNREKLV